MQDIALRGGPKVDKADVANKQQLSEQHISNRLRYSLRVRIVLNPAKRFSYCSFFLKG